MELQASQKAKVVVACILLLLPIHFVTCDIIGLYTILNFVVFLSSMALLVTALATTAQHAAKEKMAKV